MHHTVQMAMVTLVTSEERIHTTFSSGDFPPATRCTFWRVSDFSKKGKVLNLPGKIPQKSPKAKFGSGNGCMKVSFCQKIGKIKISMLKRCRGGHSHCMKDKKTKRRKKCLETRFWSKLASWAACSFCTILYILIWMAQCFSNKYYYNSHLNSRNLKNFQVELFIFPRTVFGSTKLSPDMMLTVWRLVED